MKENYHADYLVNILKKELAQKNIVEDKDDWYLITFFIKGHLEYLLKNGWGGKRPFSDLKSELFKTIFVIKEEIANIKKYFLTKTSEF